MARVASLGCIICLKMGFPDAPAELHHIREGLVGIGRKSSNFHVIPLCAIHHRNGSESYHYSPKTFTKKWGSQKKLLQEVLTCVNYDRGAS